MVDRVDLARALRVVNCPVGRPFDLLEAEERDEWLKESDEIIKWLPARHVAPPEPVVLTAEERDDFSYSVIDCEPHSPWDATLAWITEHGFALVRTGGAT